MSVLAAFVSRMHETSPSSRTPTITQPKQEQMTPSIETDNDRYEAGLEVRRAVLGDDYVTKSLESATDFTEPVQRYVTQACWGDLWTRPGLDRRSRSLINLGMLTALGRLHELGVHVRAALNNGLTVSEIQEALLHTAIYCGVPATLEAFRVAKDIIESVEAGSS